MKDVWLILYCTCFFLFQMIDRSVTILNEDKKRRLEISEEEFKDTEDQQTFIDGLLDACRDILGTAVSCPYQPNSLCK